MPYRKSIRAYSSSVQPTLPSLTMQVRLLKRTKPTCSAFVREPRRVKKKILQDTSSNTSRIDSALLLLQEFRMNQSHTFISARQNIFFVFMIVKSTRSCMMTLKNIHLVRNWSVIRSRIYKLKRPYSALLAYTMTKNTWFFHIVHCLWENMREISKIKLPLVSGTAG